MPFKFLDAVSLENNELQNVLLQSLAADPSNLEAKVYWNSVSKVIRVYNGTAWVTVGAGTYTDENAQDAIAAAFAAGAQVGCTVAYNDGANSFSITVFTLDALPAPVADVSLASHKITNLADGTATTDAATWGQVQALINGLDWGHGSVRAATAAALPAYTRTTNVITATANGALAAIDGVTLVANDRLLLKDGAAGADNGIYVVTTVGTGGTPFVLTRATDADSSAEMNPGLAVVVEEGSTLADTVFILTTNAAITLNTTALTFTQLPTPNMLAVTAPILRTGNTLSLDNTKVVLAASGVLTGGATSEVLTHNLGTKKVRVTVRNNASPFEEVGVTNEATTTNTVTIRAGANLPASYTWVVMGVV